MYPTGMDSKVCSSAVVEVESVLPYWQCVDAGDEQLACFCFWKAETPDDAGC